MHGPGPSPRHCTAGRCARCRQGRPARPLPPGCADRRAWPPRAALSGGSCRRHPARRASRGRRRQREVSRSPRWGDRSSASGFGCCRAGGGVRISTLMPSSRGSSKGCGFGSRSSIAASATWKPSEATAPHFIGSLCGCSIECIGPRARQPAGIVHRSARGQGTIKESAWLTGGEGLEPRLDLCNSFVLRSIMQGDPAIVDRCGS